MKDIEQKIIERHEQLVYNKDIVSESLNTYNFLLRKILVSIGEPCIGKKVLDVGCGKGRFCRKLKDRGFDVVGVEPVKGFIEIAKRNNPDLKFVQASATNLPFKDNSFDFLICVSVLEHIPDTERAIQEMARVLKSGGKMILIDKNILALHPRYLIPIVLWNKFLGERNKWLLYPKTFCFQEKYFIPWKLNKLIKKYFSSSKINFLYYKPDKRQRPLFKNVLIYVRGIVSFVLHKVAPFLDFYVAWEAIR